MPVMSNVIDIEKRLQLEQKKKAKVDKGKKLEYIRKFLQCKRCLARCSMCGVQFDPQEMYKRQQSSYRFCSGCQEEYEEFLRVKEKGEDTTYYWHNEEWLAIWENWLNYQESLQKYTESTEFIELLREVDWH
jgi:Pyruvate/2-oxoacid:ferredoxin oxidoreductase delta subunit